MNVSHPPPQILAVDHSIGPYDYVPDRNVAICFLTLFAISTSLHLFQSWKYRIWWILPTAIFCGVSEIVGWGARLYSSSNPTALIPFDIQISSTITGPTPLIAANFVILEYLIKILGTRFSRLSPRMYMIIFVTCDVISLSIQGAGGTIAGIAAGNGEDPTTGGNVMLIGIIIQMVAITLFIFTATEFFYRYAYDKPYHKAASGDMEKSKGFYSSSGMEPRLKIACYALAFSTTCLFIRAVYRTIELTDGWNGRIIATQVYFNVLDGGMVTLAIYTLNIFHPGMLVLPMMHRYSQNNESTDTFGSY